eukprot:84943_1
MANTEISTEGKVTHVADDIENEDSDIDVDYDWTTRSCKKYETKSLDNNVNTAHVDVSYDNINVDVVDTVHTYNNKLDHEWVTMYTSDGRVYYQNSITKKTQWEKPHFKSKAKKISLPKGWRQCVTANGRKYYQNEITKKTQWDKPTRQIPQYNLQNISNLNKNTTTIGRNNEQKQQQNAVKSW